MEPLPVKPTTLPQARRYTREFKAEGNRVFTEMDRIVIEIPPIQNAYLTKNARIYFTFDMNFKVLQEDQSAVYQYEYGNMISPHNLNVMTKPLPMLDVCGPYGFFRDMEVYDYLGNTLIEKTNRHDLLAAMMSDFYLDPEVDRLRPRFTENQTLFTDLEYFNFSTKDPGGSGSGTYASDKNSVIRDTMRAWGLPHRETRANGINLLDSESSAFSLHKTPEKITDAYTLYVREAFNQTTTWSIPQWIFSIDLLNFLGRGSDKFVPLHNGYRIILNTNKATIPIKFSLPNGGLSIPYRSVSPTSATTYTSVNIVPEITKFSISDLYLRAELLEVSPELDAQVDKVVHAKMINYQQLGKCESPTIIPGNYLSATNVKISMRHIPLDHSHSEIGFRSCTNVYGAKLLYNDALHQEYKTISEIFNNVGQGFDPSINPLSFITERPGDVSFGTSGYMYPYFSKEMKYTLAQMREQAATTGSFLEWINLISDFSNKDFNPLFYRLNNNDGKFLINFDLTLNGYKNSQIVGVDTTKTKVKIDLRRFKKDSLPYVTDVFTEYDSLITIDPGKSTSVSF